MEHPTPNWNTSAGVDYGNHISPPDIAIFPVGASAVGVNVANGINVGEIEFTGGNWGLNSGSLNLLAGGTIATPTLYVSQSNFTATIGSSTASTVLQGTLGFQKTGPGTLVLYNDNTYSGPTSINGGILTIGSAGALGSSSTVSFGGGTLEYGSGITNDYSNLFSTAANQAYSVNTNSQNVTFAHGLTSSVGTLAKAGAGTLLLSLPSGTYNTFSGGTVVSGGTLAVDGDQTQNALAAGSTVTVNNGGTFEVRGVNAVPQNLNVVVNSGGTLRVVSGTSAATTASGDASTAAFSAITLNSATFSLAYAGSGSTYLTDTSSAISGTLTATGMSAISFGTNGSSANSGLGLVGGGTNTFAVTNASDTLTVSVPLLPLGSVSALVKTGAGTLILTAANSYAGGTGVNAGTLLVNGSTATGTTAVASGGTLGGSGTVGGPVIVASGGTVSAGSPTAIGTLTVAGNVTFQSGGTGAYTWKINNASPTAALILTGLSNSNGLQDQIAINTLSNTFSGPITVNVTQLTVPTLNANLPYSFLIGTAPGTASIAGSTVNLTNAAAFASYVSAGGTASIDSSVGNVYLDLQPVPELKSLLGIAAGFLILVSSLRQRRRRANA